MNEAKPRLSGSSALGTLFKVLGRRPLVIFGIVSGLVVFLLAAVTVTSRYAMQRYVADQVERLPWDLSIYQTAEVPLAGRLQAAIQDVPGVSASRMLYFLRTAPPYTLMSVVDGQSLRSPWISVLSSNDPSLIPPDIRPTGDAAVMVLVGSKSQMGDAYLRLQDRKKFELVAEHRDEGDNDPKHVKRTVTLTTAIERVIRIDATELNRWYLEQTSSPTLVPELGIILVLPWNLDLVRDFDYASRGFIHTQDGEAHTGPNHR